MKKITLPDLTRLTSRLWLNGRYLLIGSALLLVLGFLVRQQMSWLNQASVSQLASAQKELSLALTQGVDDIRSDLQRLYSNLLAEPRVESPLITRELVITYQQQWPEYADDDPRAEWVAEFARQTGERPNPFEIERVFGQRKAANEFLLLSSVRLTAGEEQFNIRILTFDLPMLVETVFEPALTSALVNYHFRLSVQQQNLFAVGEVSESQAPDMVLPLSRMLQLPSQEKRQHNSGTNQEQPVSGFDRDFSRLYSMILSTTALLTESKTSNDIVLSVYSPAGSLVQKTNRQKWLNGFFSAMVLGLLSVTVIVLLGMTRRIKMQQQRERDFIASISHELRTPLTVIRSAADNLKDGVVTSPDSIARYGLEISKQSKRLSRMIDTTLTYSGLPGRDSQQLEAVNGHQFFKELFTPLIALAKEQNVTCHLTIEQLDHPIMIDTDALRTIGQNLVMNALIHAKPEVGPAHIWLSVTQRQQQLVLTVADNGPGIPKKEQRRIFSPFVRGKRSEQQQQPGTGLGLSLVQRTAAILQGEVTLTSPYLSDLGQTEQGCQFVVALPLVGVKP